MSAGPLQVVSPQQLSKVIQIDEDGYFVIDGLRLSDPDQGAFFLKSLFLDQLGRTLIKTSSDTILVEAFDEPLILKKAAPVSAPSGAVDENLWQAHFSYGYSDSFALETLRLDEWDRFHGRTRQNIPFVFSREAQAEFFVLLDDYDDDSITFAGKRWSTPPLLVAKKKVASADYWSEAYAQGQDAWELDKPSPALLAILPKLKLGPLRILILGAGSGQDAAYLSDLGHIVTAVDFSAAAIARAQTKFSDRRGLKFLQMDLFQLPVEMNGSFDLIFEHTCYCAIDPQRRAELLKVWRRMLSPDGHLLGIFFTMDRAEGPPFGATEWELRARLGKGFRSLYWLRLRGQSDESRYGMELLIYAQKIALS